MQDEESTAPTEPRSLGINASDANITMDSESDVSRNPSEENRAARSIANRRGDFKKQVAELRSMGFKQPEEKLHWALRRSNGNAEGAVEHLVGD